jgi:hypothetical protein
MLISFFITLSIVHAQEVVPAPQVTKSEKVKSEVLQNKFEKQYEVEVHKQKLAKIIENEREKLNQVKMRFNKIPVYELEPGDGMQVHMEYQKVKNRIEANIARHQKSLNDLNKQQN